MLLLHNPPPPPTPSPLGSREAPVKRRRPAGGPSAWDSNPSLCGCGDWQQELRMSKPESAGLTCSWRLRALCLTADAWRARPTRTCPRLHLHLLHHTLSKNKPKTEPVRKATLKREGQWGLGLRPSAQVPLPQGATPRVTSVRVTADKNNWETVLALPIKGWKLIFPQLRSSLRYYRQCSVWPTQACFF